MKYKKKGILNIKYKLHVYEFDQNLDFQLNYVYMNIVIKNNLFFAVQVCHSSYLEGIFGSTVTFSPFALEGNAPECIGSMSSRASIL